jgi:hypothetical protein
LKAKETRSPDFIDATMIAPCGMDCGLCIGFLRDKKPCSGCTGDDAGKPQSCVTCRIKNCAELERSEQGFCFECAKYPCARLRQLDKRYRTKYGMSMIENLGTIRESGIEEFVARERDRWRCPGCGGVISVHRGVCIYCGREKG